MPDFLCDRHPQKHACRRPFRSAIKALATLTAFSIATAAVAGQARDQLPSLLIPQNYESGPELVANKAGSPRWWSIYNDPELDELVARLHASNTTIAQARARLASAQAAVRTGKASQSPYASLDISGTSVEGPLINAAGESGLLYSGRVNVSWELDLLGRVAGERAAELHDAGATRALLADVTLLMEGQLVRHWFSLRAQSFALADAERSVILLGEAAQIVQARRSLGLVSMQDMDAAQNRLNAARQTQADIRLARDIASREIGFLLGEARLVDSDAAPEASSDLPQIAAGLPADLLLRRPDIAAARSRLMATDERLASARKGWLPAFGLTASGGTASSSLGEILSGGAVSLLVGALFSIPVFDGGRHKARVAGHKADVDLAEAQYRETVFAALRDVNTHLQAYQSCRESLRFVAELERSAELLRDAAHARAANGTISRLAEIDAEANYVERTFDRRQAQSGCYRISVDLQQSLGGGVPPSVVAWPAD